MQRKLLVFAMVAALFGNAGCAETSVPSDWPRDCVGRLELALPGEADQAALLPKELFRDSVQYGRPKERFQDGENAGWTSFPDYAITQPLTSEERSLAHNEFRKILERASNFENAKAQELPIGKHEGQAWMVPNKSIGLDLIVDGVIFLWGADAINEAEFELGKEGFQRILNGIRSRRLFDVPKKSGLCLPYLFIAEEGKERHIIAMTYRLRAHPDITVNLKSSSSGKSDETNKDLSDQYWDTRTAPGRLKSARTIWRLPANRPTHLAGREGLESFVAVVRDDSKEEDFIYHAVAVGNPGAPEDAPDVRLVVEQTRENAIKRGIKPMTEDEVLKLARQIAASVSKRAKR